MSKPELILNPKGNVVTEGVNLILYCTVQQGTVPITFTWYRSGVTQPLNTTKINKTQGIYILKSITRNDEGRYYCQASNEASVTKGSAAVTIQGPTPPTFLLFISIHEFRTLHIMGVQSVCIQKGRIAPSVSTACGVVQKMSSVLYKTL